MFADAETAQRSGGMRAGSIGGSDYGGASAAGRSKTLLESADGGDQRATSGEFHGTREGGIEPARLRIRTATVTRMWTLLLSIAGASPVFAQQPPEPFTPAARWAHYTHRTFGPVRLGLLAADTGLAHVLHDPKCWDSGAGSYGRRYGRAFERRIIRNTTELAAGIVSGEDLRYRASQSLPFGRRIWSAVRGSVTAQMGDGTRRPAYTRFIAGAVAEVSTAGWTGQRIEAGWLVQSMGWSTLDQIQTNLLDEFGPDLRRFGARIWKRAHPGRK
jgi:hypothetical protein